MRELKFRSWDSSKMRYWGFIEEGTFIGPPAESGCFNYPVMQYTGEKDINGVEIYEGDIIYNDYFRGYYSQGVQLGIVTFDDGGFEAVKILENGELEYLYHPDDKDMNQWEVRGNIYENPELIKHS